MKLRQTKSRQIEDAPSQKAASVVSGISPQIVDLTVRRTLGRPRKGESWRDCIQRAMDSEAVDGMTERENIVLQVRKLARGGVPWAIQWLADREDGRPAQAITVEPGSKRNPMLDLDDQELEAIVAAVKARRLGAP